MSIEELRQRVRDAVLRTGYPFEQRVGHFLRSKGWAVFHSVTYYDPSAKVQRELDILAYKIIQRRRIELRISCKRSANRPWVLFTEDASGYIRGANLKITPVVDDPSRMRAVGKALRAIPFFKHNRQTINFTALAGKHLDDDMRHVIADGLLSALSSVYHSLFPHHLMFDQRGTACFFLTLFDGFMFECFYDPNTDTDTVVDVDYAQWDTQMRLQSMTDKIADYNMKSVPLSDVMYWFSDWFRVELVTWKRFKSYVQEIEAGFASLTQDELNLFGSPWEPENFPKVGEAPRLTVATKDGVARTEIR